MNIKPKKSNIKYAMKVSIITTITMQYIAYQLVMEPWAVFL